MRVRIDKDVAKKVAANAKKNNRTIPREVNMALLIHYWPKTISLPHHYTSPEPGEPDFVENFKAMKLRP